MSLNRKESNMKVYPTLEQAKELAATGSYGVVPRSEEHTSELQSPQ